MSDLQDRIAKAMETKRAELIHQPLARIWQELAQVAINEMKGPRRAVMTEAQAAVWHR